MPKIKSHRGAGKRFWISATGKVKHKKQGKRHLLTGMSSTRSRNLRKSHYLNKVDGAVIKALLPHN